jgi:hypothetical protein
VSHVWSQLVTAVETADPINEASVSDMLEEACDAVQVSRLHAQWCCCTVVSGAAGLRGLGIIHAVVGMV